ncbi:MAG TPA: methyltransferase [Fibrobacteria bacterium]|nr:methyltransferase [Fibrobacteria bacterium]
MSFSAEWESRYRKIGGMSLWPWSDLVSHCKRHFRGDARGLKVLELGCASGANIPFFLSLGADYHGMEGSPSMVADLLARFPGLEGKVATGDFTREIPFAGPFDLIVDRSSLTHNHAAAIADCLRLVGARMKPGAKYIGIDWFSDAHSDLPLGRPAEDARTRKDFPSGLFSNVGRVHFSDQAHLADLFRDFTLVSLEHKVIEKKLPAGGGVHATWNLVAAKPGDGSA